MAFPTIPTGGRVLTTVQADTTSPRTFPNLTNLTKNAGDLLIAICCAYGSSSASPFSTWGASFTEFWDGAANTGVQIGFAYKVSTGSETGTFTVAQAGTLSGHAVMFLLSIPGADTSVAPTIGGTPSFTTGTGSADPGACNPAAWDVEDTLWIAVAGVGETSTAGTYGGVTASPTNYGNDVHTGISGDVVGGMDGLIGFRQLAAASEDPGTFTNDTSNTRFGAATVAVKGLKIYEKTGVGVLV